PLKWALCNRDEKEYVLSKLVNMVTCIKGMPKIFAFLHLLLVGTSIPMLFTAFFPWPDANYAFNGESLSYSEFITSWFALGLLVFIIAVIGLCYATSQKKRWSLYGVYAFWCAPFVGGVISTPENPTLPFVFLLLWTFYIVKNKTLKSYYSTVA
ncbi:hypothetical protein AB4250_22245, partial [Vibrio cyclitrophicus]